MHQNFGVTLGSMFASIGLGVLMGAHIAKAGGLTIAAGFGVVLAVIGVTLIGAAQWDESRNQRFERERELTKGVES